MFSETTEKAKRKYRELKNRLR